MYERVWLVTFSGEWIEHPTMLNKVFDAPKYMVEGYAKRTLKAINPNITRVVKADAHTFIGYFKREPMAFARLELHMLRDRDDDLLYEQLHGKGL